MKGQFNDRVQGVGRNRVPLGRVPPLGQHAQKDLPPQRIYILDKLSLAIINAELHPPGLGGLLTNQTAR